MKSKTTIRSSNGGWVVYFDNNVNDFMVFRADEPERFVKFITEKVAGIKLDQVIASRQTEIAVADERLGGSHD